MPRTPNAVPKSMPTVGVIARLFEVPIHRVEHIIRTGNLIAVGRAGNAWIYSETDIQFIGSELRRIARDRDPDAAQGVRHAP